MMNGEEFFLNDPNTVLKELPADMIDQLKTYQKKSDMARITGVDDGKEEMVLDLRVKPSMRKDGMVTLKQDMEMTTIIGQKEWPIVSKTK